MAEYNGKRSGEEKDSLDPASQNLKLSPCPEEMVRGVHRIPWSDSAAESLSSGFSERLCLKKIKQRVVEVNVQYCSLPCV